MKTTKLRRPVSPQHIMTSGEGIRRTGYHDGIDYISNTDKRLWPICNNMKVTFVFDKDYKPELKRKKRKHMGGKYVILKGRIHGKIRYVYYMHMDRIDVKKGDVINMHNPIGIYGNTGFSTGAHLHLGMRNGLWVRSRYWGGKNNVTKVMIRGLKESGLA